MSQENPEKIKVRIPVVVARNGDAHSGNFSLVEGNVLIDHDFTLDALSDEAYASGYAIAYITAEIDIATLFERFEVEGKVE